MPRENQHWVPKFLIKNFADNDGRVYCLDIHTDKITKRPPKRVASEPGFNDFQIAGAAVSFEDRLENIETKAAPVLRRIIERRSLGGLTFRQRKRIANFAAAQSFRTKAFCDGFAGKPDREGFGQILEQLWRGAFIIANEIAQRHWALMLIETDEVFYLGDNPVVLQQTEAPEDGSNLGFDVKGVEAFMALSPKCALYMPCRGIGDEILNGYRTAMTMHRAVRSTVLRGVAGGGPLLELTQRVMRNSYPLYRALTEGVPLAVDTPNVENFNYLQCSWARTAVYSNLRDFAFARRVFRENPQYRGVPATSVLHRTALVRTAEVA
jgi:Protein of unknown function (DUF4238)